MRSIIALIAVSITSTCYADSPRLPIIASSESTCYHSDNKDENGISFSFSTMCLSGSSAWQRVYFLNDGYLSTNCYQYGEITMTSNKKFSINYNLGRCDTGRALQAGKENCEYSTQNTVSCEAEGWHPIIFNKIKLIPGNGA